MRISSWKLKTGSPDDAVERIGKNFLDPIFAKLMASGAIHGYGVYTQAIHSMDPDVFWSVFVAAGADGLNAYDKAVGEALKQNPMAGTAFDSMIDFSMHRDDLTRIINMSEK
jgi:hypothetical protein